MSWTLSAWKCCCCLHMKIFVNMLMILDTSPASLLSFLSFWTFLHLPRSICKDIISI